MQRKRLRAGVALLALAAAASVAPGTTAPAQEARRRGRASTSTASPASSTCRAPRRSPTRRSRPATASSATPRGATSPSSSCRGSRRTLRYATISDWGTRRSDPDYNLFDRSFDLQFQLLKEKGWQPSLALGLPRLPRHRGLFRRVPGRHQDHRAGLHASPAASAGGGWPASAGSRTRSARSPTASAPATTTSARAATSTFDALLPRREDGLLRRRRVADADRQADAEGRDLVGRLYPRAAGPEVGLRAQVADQRRRRVPAAAGASRSAATTCTARPWASTSWSPATRTSR